MAFTTAPSVDVASVGIGQPSDIFAKIVLSSETFESGLKIGRFAKLDTGSIDNFDGSATPVPAGVVLRNVANAIEDGETYTTDNTTAIEYLRQGLVTVGVKTGDTPEKFGRVYISNQGDANDGLATTTNTEVAVNAEFIAEVESGTWLIYVNPAPGDVAAHITATAATTPTLIADPGDAGAIPATSSGNCAITTADAETRTLAIPAAAGITLDLSMDVDGGNAVITVASAINQAGNTTITMADAGDFVRLAATQVAGALVWRVVVNDGTTLG